MTVEELIDILSDYPPEYPVILGYTPITDVYCDENYFFADNPNPQQAVGPAIIIE